MTLGLLTLFSCAGSDSAKSPSTVQAPVHSETKNKCGNEDSYTIKGKHYQVLKTAKGYTKEAMASWYGASYQGSKTAGCEIFDMFAYTAAHRTLPLPSYVKVTHKKNGKSVIVKVNDRGPFDSQHEIELSFAAANAIGMVKSKQALVHIEALSAAQFSEQPSHKDIAKTPHETVRQRPSVMQPAKNKAMLQKTTHYAKNTDTSGEVFYVIAGTYPSNNEAVKMFGRLLSIGINQTEMATAYGDNQTFYMVRIGPLYGQDQIDNIKDRLTQDGLTSFKVVND